MLDEQVKTVTLQYETPLGNFNITLKEYDAENFRKLGKKHRKPVTNKKTRQIEYELDDDTYYPALYKDLFVTWTGLTADVKRLLCHEKIDTSQKQDMTEVPFSLAIAVKMAKASIPFRQFIESVAIDFDTLYAEQIKIERASLEEQQLREEIPNL